LVNSRRSPSLFRHHCLLSSSSILLVPRSACSAAIVRNIRRFSMPALLSRSTMLILR
jgi:hypothetical protein